MAEVGSDPTAILQRSLSTKSVLSTTSSYAERMQEAARRAANERSIFRNIGLGSCGSVFEVPGTQLAYKKGGKEEGILRDFNLTNRVYEAVSDVREALQAAFLDLNVPKIPKGHEYHKITDDRFWADNLQRFPTDHRSKQPLFSVDHILPMPREIRDSLIELYFEDDDEIQREAKEDPDNKDCLVRLYLGERETERQEIDGHETLRNFPLRLSMMEDLNLETNILGNEMALGLAFLHWQAQIDAMDVEFVLGSSACLEKDAGSINSERRQIEMWILDFDKASEFDLTKNGVRSKLVPAFLGNDPYYPRPDLDVGVWDEFCETYLRASQIILRNQGANYSKMKLPKFFLEEAARVMKENEGWNEEDNIVFG